MLVDPCDGICVRHSFEWSIGGSKFGVKDFDYRGCCSIGKDLVDRPTDLPQFRSTTKDAEEN